MSRTVWETEEAQDSKDNKGIQVTPTPTIRILLIVLCYSQGRRCRGWGSENPLVAGGDGQQVQRTKQEQPRECGASWSWNIPYVVKLMENLMEMVFPEP